MIAPGVDVDGPGHQQELHDDYDVVIVGYGPVGRLLALKLGRRGHRVVVVERQPESYPLPRAVHLDDETARILQSVGAGPAQLPHVVEPYDDFYEWRAADHTTLMRLDWSGRGPSGWNVSNFFHQPSLEAVLNDEVEALPSVTLLRGWRTVGHTPTAERVTLELHSPTGEKCTVSGRWILGADGANSTVRDWVGGGTTDLGYFHDWLVVDLVPRQPLEIDPPAWQLCDPSRPTTLVPGGPGRRRFEFMRLPGETVEVLNAETTAWRLLEPWGITPGTATVERHAVYTFQARWSNSWRRGRLLLAGDSAHLMPPFAGQGMCSGLRDATNLEWKLDLVLRGLADGSLLDSYGSERAAHVRHFIDASMGLGSVICVTDPQEVALRDRTMAADLAAGVAQPPRPLPVLGEGLHRPDPGGGTLFIQAPVVSVRGNGLFDDMTAGGGTLLVDSPDLMDRIDNGVRAVLVELGIQLVALGDEPADTPEYTVVVDSTGAYSEWLRGVRSRAVLSRPDFYVYGTAADAGGVATLANDFIGALTCSPR